jgi:hypothetical protein
MANIIEPGESRILNPDDPDTQVREYIKTKNLINSMEKRVSELRDKIFEHIEENGLEDAGGSTYLTLDTPIEGVVTIEKSRRAKRSIDEAKAEEILSAAGIEEEVYKTIRVVDEDALMAAFFEGKVTEDQLDEMYPVKVIWALTTKKK